jgi:hypothetical protein
MIGKRGKAMVGIQLKEFAGGGRLLGTRQIALPIRDQVEKALEAGEIVTLDFEDTNPTQSFVDELIGSLVLERGVEVLDGLIMKNCSEDAKAILHFVVSDRLDQVEERKTVDEH